METVSVTNHKHIDPGASYDMGASSPSCLQAGSGSSGSRGSGMGDGDGCVEPGRAGRLADYRSIPHEWIKRYLRRGSCVWRS